MSRRSSPRSQPAGTGRSLALSKQLDMFPLLSPEGSDRSGDALALASTSKDRILKSQRWFLLTEPEKNMQVRHFALEPASTSVGTAARNTFYVNPIS